MRPPVHRLTPGQRPAPLSPTTSSTADACAPPSRWRSATAAPSCSDVAAALQGRELGDGAVYRTIAQVQKRYYDPPLMTSGPRTEVVMPIPGPLGLEKYGRDLGVLGEHETWVERSSARGDR